MLRYFKQIAAHMIELDLYVLTHNILLAICFGIVVLVLAELLVMYFDDKG
jgi:hypothetical protein